MSTKSLTKGIYTASTCLMLLGGLSSVINASDLASAKQLNTTNKIFNTQKELDAYTKYKYDNLTSQIDVLNAQRRKLKQSLGTFFQPGVSVSETLTILSFFVKPKDDAILNKGPLVNNDQIYLNSFIKGKPSMLLFGINAPKIPQIKSLLGTVTIAFDAIKRGKPLIEDVSPTIDKLISTLKNLPLVQKKKSIIALLNVLQSVANKLSSIDMDSDTSGRGIYNLASKKQISKDVLIGFIKPIIVEFYYALNLKTPRPIAIGLQYKGVLMPTDVSKYTVVSAYTGILSSDTRVGDSFAKYGSQFLSTGTPESL